MTAESVLVDRYAATAGGQNLPGLKAVQAARAAELVHRLNKPHGVAVLGDPVGTGKTVIALTVAARLLAKKTVQRIVVLTPNATVARIWRERAVLLGDAFQSGTIDVHSIMDKDVFPASVKKPALIIVDEAHRKLRRERVARLISRGPQGSSKRRLFLTATPFQIAVSDLRELVRLGDREHIMEPVGDALMEYGRTVTKLAGQAHAEPNPYIATQLRAASNDWAAQANKVLMEVPRSDGQLVFG